MIDEFRTIKTESHAEMRVQGSRFIAHAFPISDRKGADHGIEKVRREHHSATHNCYGFRLGVAGTDFRSSDDGEPSGTAGRPILSAIDKSGLTDVLVVVTRYFGGVQLGVGGLARAYGNAAEQALGAAGRITRYLEGSMRVTFPHSEISNVMHVISKLGARIVDTSYDEDVHVNIRVRVSREAELKRLLIEQTRGNIGME